MRSNTKVRPKESTNRHVVASAGVRIGVRLDEFSRDTEVAQLDDTLSGEQDVRRLDVAYNHVGQHGWLPNRVDVGTPTVN